MKGVFVHQQFEFRLEVNKERFQQGDPVPCSIGVKNHATTQRELTDLQLKLAHAKTKDSKQRAKNAFQVIASADLEPSGILMPGAVKNLQWTFDLDKNCCITEKSQSLYLLFGSDSLAVEHLPLQVEPHQNICEIIRLLETSFQFLLRGCKFKGGSVIVIFKPPALGRFSLVNELSLTCRNNGCSLELSYSFKVKRLEATSSSIGIKKSTVEIEQLLDPARHLSAQAILNGSLEKMVAEVLEQVASGV